MFNRQGRVLVVDDEDLWRNQLSETLRQGGFEVGMASTTAQALDCLQSHLYHLLILDIRLVDVTGNQEGIDLLGELVRRGLGEATKVIMLSSYGTPEYMRKSFREYRVMDFLSKDDFDNEVFLAGVRQVFARQMNINLALDIRWQQVNKPEHIVLNLDIGGTRLKRGNPLLGQMVIELHDLLCRLFYQAKSILVRPLAPGHSGMGVLRVQPFFSTGGGGSEVIVKFGDPRKIEEEYHNFTEYVQPFLGGERNTTITAMRRTSHLAGLNYSLLGTTSSQVVDFGEFYRRADISQVKIAVDRLFWQTCRSWYASRGQLELVDLTADYKRFLSYSQEKLEQVLADQLVKSVQGKQKLYFHHLPDRIFTNPLSVTKGLSLVRPTYVCITHGDFNHHNLLVDTMGNMWLIDFQGTGQGHILRDVATLDSGVRYQLLTAEEATLEERLQLEEALLGDVQHFSQVGQLTQRFATQNAALAKAYNAVVHLRAVAYKLVELNPHDDISEYYIALLYSALNAIRFSSLSSTQREHALLCASLLVDRLGLGE